MFTRIYYFSSSPIRPAITWFLSKTESSSTTHNFEMQKSSKFKNLFYSDFEHNESQSSSPINFEISDLSNLTNVSQKLISPGVFCVFRRNCVPVTNHYDFFPEKKKEKSFIFFTDLDDTLFGHEEYLQEFYEHWIQNCLFDPQKKLIYATGRSFLSFCKLEAQNEIISPEYLICSNGTEIYHFDGDNYKLDQEWSEIVMKNWDPELVLKEFQKISWLEPNHNSPHDSRSLRFFAEWESIQQKKCELHEIEEKLAKKDVFISFYYSGHDKKRMLDVNSRNAGKGNASLYLMNKLKFEKDLTFGFGDSNNDLDLIRKCGKGVLVGNSQKELLEFIKTNKEIEKNITISEFNYAKALLMELKNVLK